MSFASTALFMYYDETVASMVSYLESKVRYVYITYNYFSLKFQFNLILTYFLDGMNYIYI